MGPAALGARGEGDEDERGDVRMNQMEIPGREGICINVTLRVVAVILVPSTFCFCTLQL